MSKRIKLSRPQANALASIARLGRTGGRIDSGRIEGDYATYNVRTRKALHARGLLAYTHTGRVRLSPVGRAVYDRANLTAVQLLKRSYECGDAAKAVYLQEIDRREKAARSKRTPYA